MKIFFLILFFGDFGSIAGLGDSLEDEEPGAVNDYEVSMEALKDTLQGNENGQAWDIANENEDWQQKHSWVETRGHPAWQGQDCPVESADPSQVIELDNPSTSRLWDTIVTEFSDHSDNSHVTDKSSTIDSITSQESINLILPTEDVFNIKTKRNLNVNLTSAAPPDFRSSSNSSHLVSTLKPPRFTSKNAKPNPCTRKARGSSRSFLPLQGISPFRPVSPHLQTSVSPCKFSNFRPTASRTTQTVSRTLQRTQPIPPTLQCHKRQKKIKINEYPLFGPRCKTDETANGKQRKYIVKPVPRSFQHKCSSRKPVCECVGLGRQFKMSGSCRSACATQHNICNKSYKGTTNNKKVEHSRVRRVPFLRSQREVQPNKMVIYMT